MRFIQLERAFYRSYIPAHVAFLKKKVPCLHVSCKEKIGKIFAQCTESLPSAKLKPQVIYILKFLHEEEPLRA